MRLSEKLRRTFWFLTKQARDTRRWAHDQKLLEAEAFDRVGMSGSLSAARATLERERAAAASLRARRRVGLFEGKPVVAAVKPIFAHENTGVDFAQQDLTSSLLDYLAANTDVAARLALDVTNPERLAEQLDRLRAEPKREFIESKLDRPTNQSASGARLASR